MKKRVVIIVLLLTILLCTACEETEKEDLSEIGDAFFHSLSILDYGACYEMLLGGILTGATLPDNTPETLTLAYFTDFYDRAVFETIGLIDFKWRFERERMVSDSHAELDYTLTYSCENIAAFEQQVTISLRRTSPDWRIDWSPAAVFENMDWGDKVLMSTLKQKRGEILDANANVYAKNAYGDTVYVRRSKVEDLLDVSTRLAALLQMDASEIRDIITSKTVGDANYDDFAVIKVFLPEMIDTALGEMLALIPSVGIDRTQFRPVRYYPNGSTFAHILGYTRPIEGEIELSRYDADSRVGASGLERSYEDTLAGYRGREISLVAADGTKKKPAIMRQDAIDGVDLMLTLDFDLQRRAESLLENSAQFGVTGGAIICLDPTTGDLLAATSFPNFDPNIYTFPIPDAVYEAMSAPEANEPFFNRVTIGRYPPGSTIKPFIAALALQDDIHNQHFEFTGTIDWKTRQWTPTNPDWNAPPITRVSNYSGPVNMENAIVYSDNIYFGYTAMKAGWEHLDPYLESLGFNSAFPFDVHVSNSQIRDSGSSSNLQLLASSGYGQGEMLISPLQMAYIFSAFANEGSIMKPRLVKEFKQMNGITYETVGTNQPQTLYENVLTSETLDILLPMLRKVITTGSGKDGQLLDIQTLGKTGTAEIGGNKQREIAWSISFVKSTDYERLVCVMLEVPTNPPEAGKYRHTCVKEMLAP